MGQYWKLANLARLEYVHPHPLGAGLKLIEQVGTWPGPASALLILLACSNGRGGGDLAESEAVGRWAGDRIALVGDYTEDSDLALGPLAHASAIYDLCDTPEGIAERAAYLRKRAADYLANESLSAEIAARRAAELCRDAEYLEIAPPYVDVTPLVAAALESALGFKYTGDGWRSVEWPDGQTPGTRLLAPDMIVTGGPRPDPGDGSDGARGER